MDLVHLMVDLRYGKLFFKSKFVHNVLVLCNVSLLEVISDFSSCFFSFQIQAASTQNKILSNYLLNDYFTLSTIVNVIIFITYNLNFPSNN